ncbi:hypothetical protein SeLEV6574_g05749 [Synchytrium endobioticum]|uniref:Cell cycle control protein n=1 Tax=Synchytrium endobioticum TaxID=286115 RepID=A0A507CSH7_9FUNG|nr:hypothetical protein SeLEV6574_g05749 [Synchytrium endobioticum]
MASVQRDRSTPLALFAEWRKRFGQQDLASWNPILSPRFALSAFLIAGIVLLPIGIGLLVASNSIAETRLDYTQCAHLAPPTLAPPPPGIDATIVAWRYVGNICTIRFAVREPLSPPSYDGTIGASPVFFYIRISGMYQNHHKMVSSFDKHQLAGDYIVTAASLAPECEPLRHAECAKSRYAATANGSYDSACNGAIPAAPGAQYYPCGLLANSFFTDVITDPVCVSDLAGAPCATERYAFSTKGLAWPHDVAVYGRSQWLVHNASAIPTQLIPPPQWQRSMPAYASGYNSTNFPDLSADERFIGWMMPAGMPTFRKLWGRNDTMAMAAGIYEVSINDYFDVYRFSGTKSLVYSTASVLGGKNTYIGIGYTAVGGYALAFAVLIVVLYIAFPRKMGDHALLSWTRDARGDGPGR